MIPSLLSAFLLLPVVVQAGLFEPPVINVGAVEFKKILKEDRLVVATFTAPWCGHCKSLAPEAKAAAQSLNPLIPFYNIDCDESSNRAICAEYGVKGFPTIKAFTRGNKLPPKDYQGDRKRGAMVGWATALVNEKVKKLPVPSKGGITEEAGMKEIEKFLRTDPSKMHILLVHPISASIPLMWKVLSSQVLGVSFGYVRDADNHLAKALQLSGDEKKPKIALWNAAGERTEYDGLMKYDALLSFLKGGASDSTSAAPSPEVASGSTESATSKASAPDPSAIKRAEQRAFMEAKWAKEEAKERARLAKLEERKRAAEEAAAAAAPVEDDRATGTEASEPEPAASAEIAESLEVPTGSGSAAPVAASPADPSPAESTIAASTPTSAVSDPVETAAESLLTEEQLEAEPVEESNIGGQDEEVIPELKEDKEFQAELPRIKDEL